MPRFSISSARWARTSSSKPRRMLGAAIDQGRLDAQAVEDAGELDGDVAAADDHDALGQLGQVEGLVRGDGVLDARERRGIHGPAAGGDQDLVGGDGRSLPPTSTVWASISRPRPWTARRRPSQVGGRRCRTAGRSPCPWRAGSRASRSWRRRPSSRSPRQSSNSCGELRGIDHELLGHAAADHAGAADPVLLGDRRRWRRQRGQPRGAHAARAGADDEEVVVVCHDRSRENKTSTRPHFGRGSDYIGA